MLLKKTLRTETYNDYLLLNIVFVCCLIVLVPLALFICLRILIQRAFLLIYMTNEITAAKLEAYKTRYCLLVVCI